MIPWCDRVQLNLTKLKYEPLYVNITPFLLKKPAVDKKSNTDFVPGLVLLSSKLFLECTHFHRSTYVSQNLREDFVPAFLCYAEFLQCSLRGTVQTFTVVMETGCSWTADM